MVTVPIPAALGSKTPVMEFVIPNPLHVPPLEAAISCIGEVSEHSGGTELMVGLLVGLITTLILVLVLHPFDVTLSV